MHSEGNALCEFISRELDVLMNSDAVFLGMIPLEITIAMNEISP